MISCAAFERIDEEAAALVQELAQLVPHHHELWPTVSKLGTRACRIASNCEELLQELGDKQPDGETAAALRELREMAAKAHEVLEQRWRQLRG